jgi:2-C-methyl-D-erythritol 2,4-cyclodiphosphate synthase
MTARRSRSRASGRAASARKASSWPRVGLGVDRHPFEPGRRLVLGGLVVPGADGLRGHSDADVLTHAVCDAVLGALGLPDLGTRFPASETEWRDAESLVFLRDIVGAMRARGYAIGNLDAVVLAEKPPLAPHLPAMRGRLARALGCAEEAVSVKAKRGEGLGFVGRGEGIEAHAVVLLLRAPRARSAPAGATGSGRRRGRR